MVASEFMVLLIIHGTVNVNQFIHSFTLLITYLE